MCTFPPLSFPLYGPSLLPFYDIELHGIRGLPIWVSTRSNHCSGPFKCSSIQQGVDVTV